MQECEVSSAGECNGRAQNPCRKLIEKLGRAESRLIYSSLFFTNERGVGTGLGPDGAAFEMQKKFRLTVAVALTFACVCVAAQQSAVTPLPSTPKQPVVDEYHAVKVTDNYRWLEDGKNPQVIAWTKAEDRHARALLDPLPLHTEIQQYLKKLLNQRSPSFYELTECHGLLFAMNSQPDQQQDVLVTLRSPDDLTSKHIVVDPNQIDPTHSTAIQFYVPSGKVAVSLASGGTELGALHIYNAATGAALPDVVPRVSVGGGSVAWSADGSGLYYTRYPREGERSPADLSFYEQVYYHKLGTPATEDSYIIGKDFPRVAEISLTTNDDGRYLLATVANGDGGTYEHLFRDPKGKWTRLTQFSDQVTAAVFGVDVLYMLSRNSAPRGKLVRVSLTNPDFATAQTVIPEPSAVLQDFRFSLSVSTPSYAITRTHLYVVELVGGPTEIHIFDHDGHELGTVPAEPVSSVDQIVPLSDDNILFANVSWVDPRAWCVFDATSNKTTVTAMRETSTESFADVEAVREYAISKDGTRVPVNIIRRKGTKLDGENATVLKGYGGFDLSLSRRFAIANTPPASSAGAANSPSSGTRLAC